MCLGGRIFFFSIHRLKMWLPALSSPWHQKTKDKIIIHDTKSISPGRYGDAITRLEMQWLKMIATTVLCLTVIMVVDKTQLGNNYLAPVCCCILVIKEGRRNVLSKPSLYPGWTSDGCVVIHTCTFSFAFHKIQSFQKEIFWNLDKSTLPSRTYVIWHHFHQSCIHSQIQGKISSSLHNRRSNVKS